MLARCYDKKHRAYKWYGALGIRVCERWRNSFSAFLSDMGRKPSQRHTLDRKDGKKGYSPDNCQWATWKDQQRNRSSNRLVHFRGEKMPLVVAAEIAGLPYATVWARLSKNWPIDKALSKPVHSNDGSLRSLAAKAGVNYAMVSARIRLGWDLDRALSEKSKTGPHSLRSRALAAGLPYKAVHLRVKRYGWDIERALSTPLVVRNRGS